MHMKNDVASIRWFGKKQAWVIMLRKGPAFAASGPKANDPTAVPPGTWMKLTSDGSWKEFKALKAEVGGKDVIQQIELQEAIGARNIKASETKLLSKQKSLPAKNQSKLSHSKGEKSRGETIDKPTIEQRNTEDLYTAMMQQAEKKVSKSKRRRNRKKKQQEKGQQEEIKVARNKAKRLEELKSLIRGGQPRPKAKPKSTPKPNVKASKAPGNSRGPSRNPRCFVCLKCHGFGECKGAS
ncbi:hypothetical protein AAMO2058_000075400 [Amorphochlora amoebiformis]